MRGREHPAVPENAAAAEVGAVDGDADLPRPGVGDGRGAADDSGERRHNRRYPACCGIYQHGVAITTRCVTFAIVSAVNNNCFWRSADILTS